MRRRIVGKSDMRAALRDFLDHVVDRKHANADMQLGILRTELGEHFVNQRVDVTLAQDQLNMPLLEPFKSLEPVFKLLLI
jgi:hypothetical protein